MQEKRDLYIQREFRGDTLKTKLLPTIREFFLPTLENVIKRNYPPPPFLRLEKQQF